MSDQTAAPVSRPGSPADRKTTLSQAQAMTTGPTMAAATVLWIMGCLKGHQLYEPDDALVLWWLSLLAPTALVLYRKFNHWTGADQLPQAGFARIEALSAVMSVAAAMLYLFTAMWRILTS